MEDIGDGYQSHIGRATTWRDHFSGWMDNLVLRPESSKKMLRDAYEARKVAEASREAAEQLETQTRLKYQEARAAWEAAWDSNSSQEEVEKLELEAGYCHYEWQVADAQKWATFYAWLDAKIPDVPEVLVRGHWHQNHGCQHCKDGYAALEVLESA